MNKSESQEQNPKMVQVLTSFKPAELAMVKSILDGEPKEKNSASQKAEEHFPSDCLFRKKLRAEQKN